MYTTDVTWDDNGTERTTTVVTECDFENETESQCWQRHKTMIAAITGSE